MQFAMKTGSEGTNELKECTKDYKVTWCQVITMVFRINFFWILERYLNFYDMWVMNGLFFVYVHRLIIKWTRID